MALGMQLQSVGGHGRAGSNATCERSPERATATTARRWWPRSRPIWRGADVQRCWRLLTFPLGSMTARSKKERGPPPPPAPPSRASLPGRRSGRQVVARHRSPRGRGAHQLPLVVAPRHRRRVGAGVLRSVPTPLRRGAAAVVAVTGSAFSLVGAAAPETEPEVRHYPAADVVPVAQASPAVEPAADTVTEAVAVAVEPVDHEPEIADVGGLVK